MYLRCKLKKQGSKEPTSAPTFRHHPYKALTRLASKAKTLFTRQPLNKVGTVPVPDIENYQATRNRHCPVYPQQPDNFRVIPNGYPIQTDTYSNQTVHQPCYQNNYFPRQDTQMNSHFSNNPHERYKNLYCVFMQNIWFFPVTIQRWLCIINLVI